MLRWAAWVQILPYPADDRVASTKRLIGSVASDCSGVEDVVQHMPATLIERAGIAEEGGTNLPLGFQPGEAWIQAASSIWPAMSSPVAFAAAVMMSRLPA